MLSKALHAAKELTDLNLQMNAITDEGFAALAACLREGAAPKLEGLTISRNLETAMQAKAAMQELREAREGLFVY